MFITWQCECLYSHIQHEYECFYMHIFNRSTSVCIHIFNNRRKSKWGNKGGESGGFRKYRMSLMLYGSFRYLLEVLPPISAGQSPNKKSNTQVGKQHTLSSTPGLLLNLHQNASPFLKRRPVCPPCSLIALLPSHAPFEASPTVKSPV